MATHVLSGFSIDHWKTCAHLSIVATEAHIWVLKREAQSTQSH